MAHGCEPGRRRAGPLRTVLAVAPQKPINADVREAEATEAPMPAAERPRPTLRPGPADPPKRRRRPIPAALKAIAGLFVLAIVFLAAAIVGGGNGGSNMATEGAVETPAPVVRAPSEASEQPVTTTAEELGYPGFATANTTRVGGADPAANAAAVALAVYPSQEDSQRPDAVVLADGDDWRSAIAASALMAPPLGVPLLVSGASELPEESEEALGVLSPGGSRRTRGAQVFVLGSATAPSDLQTRRIRPRGAAGAAALLSLRARLTGSPPRHVIVAPSQSPDIAMPAAAWAARSGDAVLFTGPRKLDRATAKALGANPETPVYVLGPSSAIPSEVLREIAAISSQVSRVSGEDPVENALDFARYADGGFGWDINDPGHGFVVARAGEPLDAAAAAPLSASGTWGPLLLTDSADTLPEALRGYLLDVKPGYTDDPTRAFYNHVWVIGDQEAIDVRQQAEIDQLAALARIGGEE